MKYNGKILSACALLVAASVCKASSGPLQDPEGQLMIFNIQNSTGKKMYGGVYKADIRGKVIGRDKAPENDDYYIVANGDCLHKEVYKSLNRKSEYHYLIFATDEWPLQQRVVKNKKGSQVESKMITQSLTKSIEARNVCYEIKGAIKPQIKLLSGKGSSAYNSTRP